MDRKSTISIYTIPHSSTIKEAVRAIDKGAIGTVFIVDKRGKLCGVSTDGDIRRAILRGSSLDEPISRAMNRKFVSVRESEDYSNILAKIKEKIRVIPIVDRKGKVVDFIRHDKNVRIPIASPDLRGNELAYLTDAFLSSWISSTGEYIDRFEKDFSKFCGCKYGVAVSNGTVALHLALVSLGIGKGDEVIVPDFTFAASVNAVLYTGAKPVLVDIEKDYWTIDPEEIKKAITPRTKAIMPVHIYGQPCNMDEIMKLARKHNLYVIEDSAQAHGAEFKGKKVSSFGDIGCFSFFANKVLTTGEGGMCVTNSEELYNKMRVLRDHGMSKTKKYWHEYVGFNYRMTNLQAAIGCAQLEKIDTTLKERAKLESKYRKLLAGPEIVFQKTEPSRKKITWLVSALLKKGNRDKYIEHLKTKNIDARPFFYSLSSMPLYEKYVFSNKNSLEISRTGLNFPTQTNLSDLDLNKIKKAIKSV